MTSPISDLDSLMEVFDFGAATQQHLMGDVHLSLLTPDAFDVQDGQNSVVSQAMAEFDEVVRANQQARVNIISDVVVQQAVLPPQTPTRIATVAAPTKLERVLTMPRKVTRDKCVFYSKNCAAKSKTCERMPSTPVPITDWMLEEWDNEESKSIAARSSSSPPPPPPPPPSPKKDVLESAAATVEPLTPHVEVVVGPGEVSQSTPPFMRNEQPETVERPLSPIIGSGKFRVPPKKRRLGSKTASNNVQPVWKEKNFSASQTNAFSLAFGARKTIIKQLKNAESDIIVSERLIANLEQKLLEERDKLLRKKAVYGEVKDRLDYISNTFHYSGEH